jgi:3,4-dihydroxy 2-butanone 4-phosphate synthase/GTP cyclohydrolase II
MEAVRYAEADLPTRWGRFRLIVYRFGDAEELALVQGDVHGARELLVRVHSECLTGEVFGSLRCDCRDQLDLALDRIATAGAGALVYLRQEGRGIGLGNKVKAYALQEAGRDTVDANLDLGFSPDLRTYERAAAILRDLGVASARLLTNNPAKIQGLIRAGVPVVGHELIWATPTEHNSRYLTAKRERLGHLEQDEPSSESKTKAQIKANNTRR